MTLYILGTTVSANIYLYNTKSKISASSIWDSKQLLLLLFNLIINLGVLFIGLHVIHNELVFNLDLQEDTLRLFLIFHLLLTYFSYLLFSITLWSFIKSFWQSYNMKKLRNQVDRLVYRKKWFRLAINYKQIVNYSDENFKKHIGKIELKTKSLKKHMKLVLEVRVISVITRYVLYSIKYLYRFFHFVYIFSIKKHELIERTSILTLKDIDKLGMKLEILSQNLEYVITSNSDKGMNEYCKEWNGLFSKVITMLFHIKCKEKNEKNISELYRLLIHNQSKLISITSSNHEQRKFHKQFITTMFSGLAYKEEYISSVYFDKRSSSLEKIYFEELFELLINLMQNKNVEIFTLLQNDEINIKSLLASRQDHDKYYGSRNRKRKYEELFTSILIKMVELNINDNLTTIMAVILSLRNEVIDSTKNTKRSTISLTAKKKRITEASEAETEVKLAFENKRALIYAAIKANEVENLMAAGYIVKVLSSNIKLESLINAITRVNMTPKGKKNIDFHTGIYKVDFNDYSFHYCLDKTIMLISAQYFLKNDTTHMMNISPIFNDINYEYFLDKFTIKTKEYNMIALGDKNLKKFKEYIEQEARVAES